MSIVCSRDLLAKIYAERDRSALHSLVRQLITAKPAPPWMQHPLGFYHVLLYSAPPTSLRLHYWPADERPVAVAITPYHDHVWSLQSALLVGKLENVLLSLRNSGDGDFEIANIGQSEGVDAVAPTKQRVTIASTTSTTQSSGDFYEIEPRMFHCTHVAEGAPTITAVWAEVTVPGGPRTLFPTGYEGHAPARVYLSEEAVAPLLADVLELLD